MCKATSLEGARADDMGKKPKGLKMTEAIVFSECSFRPEKAKQVAENTGPRPVQMREETQMPPLDRPLKTIARK